MELGLEQVIVVGLTVAAIAAIIYLRKRSQADEDREERNGNTSGKL